MSASTPNLETTCPYCGVGCGVSAKLRDDSIIAVSGDKTHPANYGALCKRVSAPRNHGKSRSAALPVCQRSAGRLGHRPQYSGSATERGSRAARPRRHRLLPVRTTAHRGLLRGQQTGQGLSGYRQCRYQLPALYVICRCQLQAGFWCRCGALQLRRPGSLRFADSGWL